RSFTAPIYHSHFIAVLTPQPPKPIMITDSVGHWSLSKSCCPMPPRSCWFLAYVWWLPLMIMAAADQKGDSCSAKRCGNHTISHPFWLVDDKTGRSCGPLDFAVTCRSNGTPVLQSFGDEGFEITSISYKERSLRVVDLYKQDHLHNNTNSCHVPSWNASDQLGRLFRVEPVNLKLVLYNCTKAEAAAVARRDRAMVPIRCGNKSNAFVRAGGRYDATDDYARYHMEGCEATVVPVLGGHGMANASNYEQLISGGFLLTWHTGKLASLISTFFWPHGVLYRLFFFITLYGVLAPSVELRCVSPQ
uniref:Wall-associated receptor kinase galacturonan-binding domain-containing protein n=2 Tax=Aegilops tauschii TaxID=37682 RepID=A0A453DUJ4_AEGTS